MTDRAYFRVNTVVRLSLRPIAAADEQAARRRVQLRHVPDPVSRHLIEEAGVAVEHRALLDVMARISLALSRIDRRLEDLIELQLGRERGPLLSSCETEINISGSGFSVPFALDVEPGGLVEIYLDMWDAGIPMIPALARVVRCGSDADAAGEEGYGSLEEESAKERVPFTALVFEEILPDDRERLIQLAIRRQGEVLRQTGRGGEA